MAHDNEGKCRDVAVPVTSAPGLNADPHSSIGRRILLAGDGRPPAGATHPSRHCFVCVWLHRVGSEHFPSRPPTFSLARSTQSSDLMDEPGDCVVWTVRGNRWTRSWSR